MPTVRALKTQVEQSDLWYEQYVTRLNPEHLSGRIAFKFTDGDSGVMTREEILFHVLAHSAYHRGNIGMLLSDCGIDKPQDTFTRFLHLEDPSRRSQT